MTTLDKPVTRIIRNTHRPLVITLSLVDGDGMIEIREKGRHDGYCIGVSGLYMILAKRAADEVVAERKAKRGTKRGMIG